MNSSLFNSVSLGALHLSNRIVMSPMTRDRAGPDDVPGQIMIDYYRQRASAGLIVTEGVQPSAEGKGYWRTPGIWSDAQIEGWRKIADAVHADGGKIVMQIMHCGRVVVPDNRSYVADVIAPSPLACPDPVPGPDGTPMPTATPRALAADELPALAEQFAQAARNAVAAGLDGVELHAASGYLINQFLNPASNHRTDAFGGSPENRARFPLMVLEAMAKAIGANRVGLRISPGNPYNGMDATDPAATFIPLLKGADPMGLAYVHVVDMKLDGLDTLAMIRDHCRAPIIANNMLTAQTGSALLAEGRADAISFGRAFIANPDLVARLREGAPLAKPNYSLLYTGEDKGYVDYPPLVQSGA